jgi:hypothetical protein
MTPNLKLFSIAAALFLVAACSDDTKAPQPEAQVTKDLKVGEPIVKADINKGTDGPKADAPKASDAAKTEPGKKGDLSLKFDATNLTCALVSACSDACAAACGSNIICLMGCPNSCGAKACANSAAPWKALSDCVTSKCALKCALGHNADCEACVTGSCASEITACNAATC